MPRPDRHAVAPRRPARAGSALLHPPCRRTHAASAAQAAYDRLLALLTELTEEEWSAPTECAPRDVADMVGHLIGAARSGASLREAARQQWLGARKAGRFDGSRLDATNDVQVRDNAALTPAGRAAALRAVAPAAGSGLPGAGRAPGAANARCR